MARSVRKHVQVDEALSRLMGNPAISLGDWAALNHVNRNTAARAVAAGKVEGAYRVGGLTRIASAPWRARFGLMSA